MQSQNIVNMQDPRYILVRSSLGISPACLRCDVLTPLLGGLLYTHFFSQFLSEHCNNKISGKIILKKWGPKAVGTQNLDSELPAVNLVGDNFQDSVALQLPHWVAQ